MFRHLATALVLLGLAASADAQSILVLNGNGSNNLSPHLISAGFNVITGTLNPGEISSRLAVQNDITQIWIWNDGTYGNTGTPANPARDFDAADLAALTAFNQTHPHFIMDCFAWRSNGNTSQQNFTKNEALALQAAGGGVVLGTDDASGDALVQHVNQVTDLFGFNPFEGVYSTPSSIQYAGGSLLSAPNAVTPSALVGTTSYAQAPHGLQPNGRILNPAIFGSPSSSWPGYNSPPLGSEVIDGTLYTSVNFLVTTDLEGGGISDFSSFCLADGSATPCPCGNDNPLGGCLNSTGNGALLLATGSASIAADDMQIDVIDLPLTSYAILFDGAQQVNVILGNGIRCVGGPVRRLFTMNVDPLGSVNIPNIASLGGYTPGTTAYFQAWYNDASGLCGAVHSVSNAMAVTFEP